MKRTRADWKDIARELYNSLKVLADDVNYGHLDLEGQAIGKERVRRAWRALGRYERTRYPSQKNTYPENTLPQQ